MDYDGQTTHSRIVSAQLHSPSQWYISEPFPNPTHGATQLRITAPFGESATLRVTNQLGQLVHQAVINLHQGDQILDLPAQEWTPGLYFITFQGLHHKAVKKLIVD